MHIVELPHLIQGCETSEGAKVWACGQYGEGKERMHYSGGEAPLEDEEECGMKTYLRQLQCDDGACFCISRVQLSGPATSVRKVLKDFVIITHTTPRVQGQSKAHTEGGALELPTRKLCT